jgi:RimJ/RimL family protein N-acetyltransferase
VPGTRYVLFMLIEVRGPRLVLRPFRSNELGAEWDALLEMAREEPTSVGQELDEQEFQERLERSGQFLNGRLYLAIDLDGEAIGLITSYVRTEPHAEVGTFGMGIALHKNARGQGYGREAAGLLTDWLFEEEGAERVEAGTGIGNVAMQTVFKQLGWGFKGPIYERGREGYLFALDRRDWEALGGSQADDRDFSSPKLLP